MNVRRRLAFALSACLPLSLAAAAELPTKAPVPELREDEPPGLAGEAPASAEIPLPTARPSAPASSDTPAAHPLPLPNEDLLKTPPPGLGGKPAETAMPEDEIACRARLKELGAEFKELAPVQEPSGCSMPHPISVEKLTSGIEIVPEVVLNCATTEAAARFAKDVISPSAKKDFGSGLKSIAQASGYVCRPRNGTQKLSEHAFGNALDIASFTLENGNVVTVEPAPSKQNETFLRAVRNAACGPFKTVLGPGSDADHSLHFHFDLAQRRNGGTFCQ